MSTYTGDFDVFEQNLQTAINQIGMKKLVVGLETIDTTTNLPYTTPNIAKRFEVLLRNKVDKIAFWRSPIYQNFIPFIEQFVDAN